jgi:hypothetical protein
MTPIEIEVLLRFHWDPHARLNLGDAPAYRAAIKRFLRERILVEEFDGVVKPNGDALAIYVEALCAVPLPVLGWRMP